MGAVVGGEGGFRGSWSGVWIVAGYCPHSLWPVHGDGLDLLDRVAADLFDGGAVCGVGGLDVIVDCALDGV